MDNQLIKNLSQAGSSPKKMPLLFIGHGNPMNAIEPTEFAKGWYETAQALPVPKAILCISAHWETKGTMITAMEKPKTIHDFGGFPQELFNVQYPAPGKPELALQTQGLIHSTESFLDYHWGLDHGCWSVVKNMYPQANIPVIQMSIDYTQKTERHYQIAKEIASLRNKGVLILGSGNMVHNLGIIDWHHPESGYTWAIEANRQFKKLIAENNHAPLINYSALSAEARLSVPTPEHFIPLLYILGLKNEKEEITFFNDKTVMGSISMTSFIVSE